MHHSSLQKARCFRDAYAAQFTQGEGRVRVLDVGARSYDQTNTHRALFEDPRYDYVGLDVEEGPNVTLVPASPYVWDEIPDDSIDVALSGQTFEHNPVFWVTFCEMARVLRPGGLMFIAAPGAGGAHFYPYDCWRFYPDAWRALSAMAGTELLESWYEPDDLAETVDGGVWRDSCAIVRKPDDPAINDRLRTLCAPFAQMAFTLPDAPMAGPAFTAWREQALASGTAKRRYRGRWRLLRHGLRIFGGR